MKINDLNIIHWCCINRDMRSEKYRVFLNYSKIPVNKPEWLTIITSFTDRYNAILIDQLDLNNTPYINATDNIDSFNFVKGLKPKYYYEVLKNVNTEYAIIMDSYDSIIINFDNIIEKYNEYGKDILYNAFPYNFPIDLNYDTGCNDPNKWCKINSGVVFGKTEKLKEFYKGLSEFVNENYDQNNQITSSEQYHITKYLNENNINVSVGVDYNLNSIVACLYMDISKDNDNEYIFTKTL